MSLDDEAIARAAVTAMRDELQAYPKPGLVSPVDSGAHADMDFDLMCRSADSLLSPFVALAAAGRAGHAFDQSLVPLGIEAERGMLAITGGVNTHRGAIFSVGLLVAAIARAQALASAPSPAAIRAALSDTWGDALAAHAARSDEASHGGLVRRRTGRDGARREAARAFPGVFETGLPAYRHAREAGLDDNSAGVQTLFALMAAIDDTTVLYRGGLEAGSFVRQSAAAFLAHGGCRQPDWFKKAEALHRAFIARNLSAGGCADLLACTLLVARCCGDA
ncbi:triphosphoribosyl-dephospho-CoA synthase MdcB [Reyranella sp.]|jgi:triphosphoribosyl-dephospho-CoA synthase|uniref:triphosphoribosyl-dephospho-CoA synthase MdcB n=1 Tax=Reyranella sp. TaxID=1929291 RepID=UPI002603AFE6|nr:triphosphoribosyl-dephospho-CoA synthase MdcB [Reyranella sp.]HQS19298.1 triphosphoribosyl-dephospho-CoA synthase MdcB [Reyranella sp.]HQT15569.1 triphosphoribosyl-dephospho-CoA synthase MdcB [Reyranella sp.]